MQGIAQARTGFLRSFPLPGALTTLCLFICKCCRQRQVFREEQGLSDGCFLELVNYGQDARASAIEIIKGTAKVSVTPEEPGNYPLNISKGNI